MGVLKRKKQVSKGKRNQNKKTNNVYIAKFMLCANSKGEVIGIMFQILHVLPQKVLFTL